MLTVWTGLENKLLIRSKQTYLLKKKNHSKENDTKIQYINNLLKTWGWMILQHVFINLFSMYMKIMT